MVRPILEYGNLIWGPLFKLDQKAMKKYNIKPPVSEIALTPHLSGSLYPSEISIP